VFDAVLVGGVRRAKHCLEAPQMSLARDTGPSFEDYHTPDFKLLGLKGRAAAEVR